MHLFMVVLWSILGIIFVSINVPDNIIIGMLCFICASIFMAAKE